MEDLLVLGQRLDLVILEVSSNLDDSVILFCETKKFILKKNTRC